ncbi:MAG: hypothetical protein ACRETT_10565, partial [Steroidobacteraceae bacterium]
MNVGLTRREEAVILEDVRVIAPSDQPPNIFVLNIAGSIYPNPYDGGKLWPKRLCALHETQDAPITGFPGDGRGDSATLNSISYPSSKRRRRRTHPRRRSRRDDRSSARWSETSYYEVVSEYALLK